MVLHDLDLGLARRNEAEAAGQLGVDRFQVAAHVFAEQFVLRRIDQHGVVFRVSARVGSAWAASRKARSTGMYLRRSASRSPSAA
ncbi:MAG: hypothetical protein ACP5XB_15205 [Isosphaeraceae bacterium]